MAKVKTSEGFEAEIDESCIDDMELFDAISEYDSGNKLAFSRMVSKLMGDQKGALYDHYRDERGRVSFSSIASAFFEILDQLGGKN